MSLDLHYRRDEHSLRVLGHWATYTRIHEHFYPTQMLLKDKKVVVIAAHYKKEVCIFNSYHILFCCVTQSIEISKVIHYKLVHDNINYRFLVTTKQKPISFILKKQNLVSRFVKFFFRITRKQKFNLINEMLKNLRKDSKVVICGMIFY